MNIKIDKANPRVNIPDFDVIKPAKEVYFELIEQLDFEPTSFTLRIIFGVDRGTIKNDGIYLPSRFEAGATFSEQDGYKTYLKHELVHYLLQILYKINPVPTSFINEGTAQSQAEGLWMKPCFGFDYHDLAAEIFRQDQYVPLRDFLDSRVFLNNVWRPFDPVLVSQTTSFCGWLIQEYGITRWKEVFRRAKHDEINSAHQTQRAIESVLEGEFDQLISKWKAAVSSRKSLEAEQKVRNWANKPAQQRSR